MNNDNYYQILGISKNADDNEIRRAYKREALKYHPDKNPENKEEAEKNFKKVNEAYSILSDKNKKKQYDTFGKSGLNSGKGGFTFSHSDAQNIFSTFFGGNDPFDLMNNGTIFDEMKSFNNFGNNFKTHTTRRVFNINSMEDNSNSFNNYISQGKKIVIKKLKNNCEKNGKNGTIRKFSISKNRYYVILENNGEILSLKFDNIQQIVNIKITNLKDSKELNGQMGKIIGYDEFSDRFRVFINNKIINIKNENIIIENDTCVKVCNIKNNTYYNGLFGKIIDYKDNRYLVKLNNEKILKLKCDNIRI